MGRITDSFLACRSQLVRLVSRIVPPHDIEDILQETYIRVFQYQAVQEISEPRALMVSVARNVALDHVKKAENRLTRNLAGDEELEAALARNAVDDSLNAVVSNEEFSMFCDAVRQLPGQCRKAFVLKKVYGFSQREIAQQLGIAESTVEKHIASGLLQCTRYLRDRAGLPRSSGAAEPLSPNTVRAKR